MSSIQWSELEQEPYDPEEFVERLAWRAMGTGNGPAVSTRNPFFDEDDEDGDSAANGGGGGGGGGSDFDADQLNDSFVSAIKELMQMHEKQKRKLIELEAKTRDEELIHRKKVAALIERNRRTAATYKSLDEKINSVATKVIHLGDQLESVNTPRSRDVEALKLMRHFEEFLHEEASLSSVFNDSSRLHVAADIILKLQLIAQELPKETFKMARDRIDAKYSDIEQKLLDEFAKSHRSNDPQRMKDLASILSQFRRYNLCVDEFIGQIQTQRPAPPSSAGKKDVFKDIVPICQSSWNIIKTVFPNPQQVMSKFLLNIYYNRIKIHIETVLSDKKNSETYLSNLFDVYSKTSSLTKELSQFSTQNFKGGTSDHMKAIFKPYLDTYINLESRYLNDKCTLYLQRYYKSLGHQKANVPSGARLQDIKRDIKGLLAAKANINLDSGISYGGETFLSEEVAINLLQLTRTAFRRAQVLSNPKDLAGNAVEIFNILVSYLIHEHVDYGLDIGLQGIPIPELCKTVPELYFFDVVRQTNAIIHLFEKQFNDSLVPLVESTPKHGECLQKKKNELEKLEIKLDAGLDRSLSAIAGFVKHILTTDQKKTDFNPIGDQSALATSSQACLRVVKFVNGQVAKIRDSVDGKNVELVLLELGLRLHRVIYDHLLSFTYGDTGVMLVICDVQEYRKCVGEFKVPAVNKLFDTLHAMCNLLFLPPENIKGAIQADDLNNLDPTILDNWIQLRADYKSKRVATYKD